MSAALAAVQVSSKIRWMRVRAPLHQLGPLAHHERAFALDVLHNALVGQFVVRPGDGEHRDPQLLGELAQGGQRLPCGEFAREHRRSNLILDLLVDRFSGHG